MNSGIEVLRSVPTNGIRVALLDFDGTLSLIRQGWQEVMVTYMMEVLGDHSPDESSEELLKLIEKFVSELTGKQTIYQMLRLAEEVRVRGGTPKDPLFYKHCFITKIHFYN